MALRSRRWWGGQRKESSELELVWRSQEVRLAGSKVAGEGGWTLSQSCQCWGTDMKEPQVTSQREELVQQT